MRRLSFAVVLLLAAPLACAQVYKWTDAKGIVHFSETPPPSGTKYKQVDIAASSDEETASSSANAPTVLPSSSSSSAGNQIQTMADTPDNRAKLCTQLQSSISTLSGSAPVVVQQDSQQTLLNADQRKQQLDTSQSEYQTYCAK